MSQCWRKDGTKKGAKTGVEKDVVTLGAEKEEQTNRLRGGRNVTAKQVLRGQEGL